MKIFPPRWVLGFVLVGIISVAPACDDDEVVPSCDPCPPPVAQFQNLTEPEHVLNNFELAYNKRNISQYDKILDVDFTFFLTPGDVDGGLPDRWGRAEEVQYNTDLLNTNHAGSIRCKAVFVDLQFEPDKIEWTALTPASAPDETWYFATIDYRFRFDFEPDTQYESGIDTNAQFTVRNAGTDAAPHWQLVEFRDLGGAQAFRATAGVKPTTWGSVKALYR